MRTEQLTWTPGDGWTPSAPELGTAADVVLAFGGPSALVEEVGYAKLREMYPGARIIGCSTAGEIGGTRVYDDTLIVTAIDFEKTKVRGAVASVRGAGESHAVGVQLARELSDEDLRHVLVLSNGLLVNGSELVRGLTENLPERVTVTGGLSGDGARFQKTWVMYDDEPRADGVVGLGFYGDALSVGYGSLGGWDPFGPQRLVTRSQGSVLYELDGHPALDLYKRYLGAHAHELPASGLLFPLLVTVAEDRDPVVRTILSVNEEEGSMTFAGDVPEGAVARLMKANFNRLVDGAAGAAERCTRALPDSKPELALLISCVGRKLVLKQRVEEEVEAVREVLGGGATLAGFYSYGEISPFTSEARCELHNQTMTITTFSED